MDEKFWHLIIFLSSFGIFLKIFSAEEIKELWAEYENNSSLEANLVKDFDKVCILLLLIDILHFFFFFLKKIYSKFLK